MNFTALQNKLIAVLGAGKEGMETARYLLQHGLKPVLFDQRPWSEFSTPEKNAVKSLRLNFIFGIDAFLELPGFDLAFRSPGINLNDPALKSAARKGLVFSSQTKFFFDLCPCKIIGVTGTKGKGTTATLIYKILKSSKKFKKNNIYITGNIGGISPFKILNKLKPDDWVVYELSSYQLADLHKSPHIAVVLMLAPEHLNYHKTFSEYLNAKSNIVRFQKKNDFCIVNSDNKNSLGFHTLTKASKIFFGSKNYFNNNIFLSKDSIIYKSNKVKDIELVNRNEVGLIGEYNLENIMAASAAALAAGCEKKAIAKSVKNFRGLKHRMQLVAKKQGILFYNDSFSTVPESAIAAISCFSKPIILILGGSVKDSDFSMLAKTVSESPYIKSIILIGQEAKKIKTEINRFKNSLNLQEGASTMSDVFKQIKNVAVRGDVVLLSPACASFGMFKNYKDRGEQFIKYAKKFAHKPGVKK